MKGITAFEAIGQLSDHWIMSAVLPQDEIPVTAVKRPSPFARFMNSGWGVAAVCAIVAVGVMGGMIWAGRQPPPASEHTSTTATDTSPENEETTATDTSPENEETTEPETTDVLDPPISADLTRIRQYTWDGWGISNKKLDEKAAVSLIKRLRTLQPTGEYTEALASGTMAEGYDIDVPETVKRGTYWIEAEGKVYRVSPDLDAIWLVDRHYGSGEKLHAESDFFDVFYDLWKYHPYDSYVAFYEGDELTVKHAYEATSPVRVEIVKLEPDFLTDDIDATDKAQHKITLRITATEDIQTRISLGAQYSDDHRMMGDGADLSLKAGVPQTITLTYPGRLSWGFEVHISIENVRIYLYHRPV